MIYPIRYIKITQYPHKNNDLSIDFGKEKNVSNTPILACDDGIVKRIEYQKKIIIYVQPTKIHRRFGDGSRYLDVRGRYQGP